MSDFDLTEGLARSPARRPENDHAPDEGGGDHHEHPEHAAMLGLQRSAGNAATASLVQRDPAALVQDTVSSGGQALPDNTREKMESSFGGADFSGVRVHTGSEAAESAQAVQAHAYTVGDHLVFQDGQYAPGTSGGDRTLAHELTHVMQQREGPVDGEAGAGGLKISDPSDKFEKAAEANADVVASGGAAESGHAGAGGSVQTLAVQRQEAEGMEEEKEETPVERLAIQRQEAEGVEEEKEETPLERLAIQRQGEEGEEETEEG